MDIAAGVLCILTVVTWFLDMSRALLLPTSYGVIIDAGSSGSRIRLYKWLPRESQHKLPKFEEFYNKKKEPGISDFVNGNLAGLRSYLTELLSSAEEHIPAEDHSHTPIYLMATAGMRLLLEPNANIIMDTIQTLLGDAELCPFRFSDQQARILSGEEEGVFGWIAANYLNNYFDDPDGRESAGVLELGGASTQIAFVPEGSILADKFPVQLAGRSYPLYVHSYLYMGQNFADLWVKEYLQRDQPRLSTLTDPCMLRGDQIVHNISGSIVTFLGGGDPDRCRDLVNKLVFKVEPYQCHPKPCAIGQVYQPTISQNTKFYALSAFTFPLRTLDVLDKDGVFTPRDTTAAADVYCRKDIDTIIAETGKKPNFLSVECLMAIYIPILFTKGYGFAEDTRQVAAKFDINGYPAEWTLGAIIYETERVTILCPQTAEMTSSALASNPCRVNLYLIIMLLHIAKSILSPCFRKILF